MKTKGLLLIWVAVACYSNILSQNYENGSCRSGNCSNGSGTFVYDSGDVYVGNFSQNKRNGYGEYTFKSGAVYKGNWRNDLKEDKNGVYISKTIHYTGSFENDYISGYGTVKYVSGKREGDSYTGNFVKNLRHGKGEYSYSATGNRKIYVGEFKNDKFDGQGALTFKNGEKWDGLWKDDEFLGTKDNNEQVLKQLQELRNIINNLLSEYERELKKCTNQRNYWNELAYANASMAHKKALESGGDVIETVVGIVPVAGTLANTSIAEAPAKLTFASGANDDVFIEASAKMLSKISSDATNDMSNFYLNENNNKNNKSLERWLKYMKDPDNNKLEPGDVPYLVTTTFMQEGKIYMKSLINEEIKKDINSEQNESLKFLNNIQDEKTLHRKIFDKSAKYTGSILKIAGNKLGQAVSAIPSTRNLIENLSQSIAYSMLSDEYGEQYTFYTACETRKTREVSFLKNVKEKFDLNDTNVLIARTIILLKGKPFHDLKPTFGYDDYEHYEVLNILREKINSNSTIDIAKLENSIMPTESPKPLM